jgi:hypothetical protein
MDNHEFMGESLAVAGALIGRDPFPKFLGEAFERAIAIEVQRTRCGVCEGGRGCRGGIHKSILWLFKSEWLRSSTKRRRRAWLKKRVNPHHQLVALSQEWLFSTKGFL